MNDLAENLKSFGKILLAMYGVTALLLFLLSFLVQHMGLEGGVISVGICAVYVISTFAGGFLAGKVQKTKKFIWGILTGLMYMILMLVITFFVKKGFDAALSDFVINLLLCVGGGMLGGMIS